MHGPDVVDISRLYSVTGHFTYDPGFASTAACKSGITYIDDINDPVQCDIAALRMIAKMPTIAAMAYKYSIGQPFIYPRKDLDYASYFLYMTFAVPCEEYKVNPVLAHAMDRIFILHADNEQGASTSTVRLAGSSGANPFA